MEEKVQESMKIAEEENLKTRKVLEGQIKEGFKL